jgi:hypothetical protein
LLNDENKMSILWSISIIIAIIKNLKEHDILKEYDISESLKYLLNEDIFNSVVLLYS